MNESFVHCIIYSIIFIFSVMITEPVAPPIDSWARGSLQSQPLQDQGFALAPQHIKVHAPDTRLSRPSTAKSANSYVLHCQFVLIWLIIERSARRISASSTSHAPPAMFDISVSGVGIISSCCVDPGKFRWSADAPPNRRC